MKMRVIGAEMFYADRKNDGRIERERERERERATDGHADMTKLIVAFRNFGNVPKN
jgi:hypothetical protein